MKVLVIGAGKGLGNVLCDMLAERGHQVVVGYYGVELEEKRDGNKYLLPMDVTNEEQMKAAAKEIRTEVGTLDAVVDVAGILLPSDRTESLMTESVADISRHMQVNAIGLVTAFRTIYPIMEKGSRFYAVTSEGGSFTLAGTLFPAYGVSKTAANKFVQVLRLTVTDVDLIAVHPGRMNTEMGKTTAQIEPEESAEGFCKLIEGVTPVNSQENWFIDYQGKPMPV